MGVFLVTFAALCLLGLTTGQSNTNNFYCNSGGSNCCTSTPHVAFSVARNLDFVPAATARVPFNVVLYNGGGHFDTTTNVFTVPVTGLYSVYFGGVGDGDGKLTYLTLYAGNPEVPVARTYDYTAGHGSAGVRVLLELKKDDTVSVWMYQSGTRYGLDGNGNSVFFNGYLVHPL